MLKKTLMTMIVILFSFGTISAKTNQNVTGSWSGSLAVQGVKLRLSFNVSDSAGVLSSTMDSPDQGAYDIPTDSVVIKNDSLFIFLNALKGLYKGRIGSDYATISGEWKQGGMVFPLELTKGEKVSLNRPQEPHPPYPYLEEEISYTNPIDSAVLAGTLTLPKGEGSFPAVLLITGSGAQDRNELIFGHKLFKVIADHLTRLGVAVLRVDDRGYGESTGDMMNATTHTFVGDVNAGVEYLKSRSEIDNTKIGLIGHSEGAIIAPIVATSTNNIDFIVMLAGSAVDGHEVLITQAADLMRAMGITESIIESSNLLREKMYEVAVEEDDNITVNQILKKFVADNHDKFDPEFLETVDTTGEQGWALAIQQAMSPWMKFFLEYDPYPTLAKVKCPALFLIGDKDLQVNAEINAPLVEKALAEAGNDNYQVIRYPNLNHLFQNCETGLVNEYGQIEETIDIEVLSYLGSWISNVIK